MNGITQCPQCGSNRLYKDGLRYLADGKTTQRWLCRNCGYRFSDRRPLQENPDWQINTASALLSTCQVCDEPKKQAYFAHTKGMKSLAEVETRKRRKPAGGTKIDQQIVEGLIVKFMAWLEAEGYGGTVYLSRIKRLASIGTDLFDPEDVKRKIAEQPWKSSVKMLTVYAYDAFCKMMNITWRPPTYIQEDSIPFVPEERELDQLIAGSLSKRMRTFLQILKETYADPGEAIRLRWIDINTENRVISINHPVKGHNAGVYKVSSRLIGMIGALPWKTERVFGTSTYQHLMACYYRFRQRIARQLKNPRILKIEFRSFRHWGGTKIAFETNGNVLCVQKALRHKNINNSLKYIHLAEFREDQDFDIETATTHEEIKKLLQAGFEKKDELNGVHYFRRPKRFNGDFQALQQKLHT